MSNVKPGQIAKIIKPHFRHGSILEVVRDSTQQEREALIALEVEWSLSRKVWLVRLITGSRGVDSGTGSAIYLYPGEEAWIDDAYLRPINDPGDDAADESRAWLPPIPLPTILPEMIPAKEEA